MTMLSYSIKQILTLVPEVFPLIKQANLEAEYPLDNKADVIASALRVSYEQNVLGRHVDSEIFEKVAMAVDVHNAEAIVKAVTSDMLGEHRGRMEKTASAAQAPGEFLEKQAQLDAGLCGYKDIPALVKQAEELNEVAKSLGQEPSDTVLRYSCDAWLNKEAALVGLNTRYHLTKNDMFVKLAAALGMEESLIPSGPLVKSFCETITSMDKAAGLDWKGFDIYKECLLTKSAAVKAMTVKVGKQQVPVEKIMRIPRHHISNYLGDDIAKGMTDPQSTKAVIESLPADMHSILGTILKGC